LESERSTRSREELQADFPKISRLIGWVHGKDHRWER
jgi:hypothetical protein